MLKALQNGKLVDSTFQIVLVGIFLLVKKYHSNKRNNKGINNKEYNWFTIHYNKIKNSTLLISLIKFTRSLILDLY